MGWAIMEAGAVYKDRSWHNFYLILKTIYDDDLDPRFREICFWHNKEIYLLEHAILHPQNKNKVKNLFSEQELLELLCSAPCSGNCTIQKDYPPQGHIWPDYNCANTPNWLGQRFEAVKFDDDIRNFKEHLLHPKNRIFNGLDYMNMFNLFANLYGKTPYNTQLNIDKPTGDPSFSDNILGSSILCPNEIENYILVSLYPEDSARIDSSHWFSSNNISLLSQNVTSALVQSNSLLNPSYIGAKASISRLIDKRYGVLDTIITNGELNNNPDTLIAYFYATREQIRDKCLVNYRKDLDCNNIAFYVSTNPKPCFSFVNWLCLQNSNNYNGPLQLSWVITNSKTSAQTTSNDICPDFEGFGDPYRFELYHYQVQVTWAGGDTTIAGFYVHNACDEDDFPKIVVNPNPTTANGTEVYINPSFVSLGGGTVVAVITDLAGQPKLSINISNSPNSYVLSSLLPGQYVISTVINTNIIQKILIVQ